MLRALEVDGRAGHASCRCVRGRRRSHRRRGPTRPFWVLPLHLVIDDGLVALAPWRWRPCRVGVGLDSAPAEACGDECGGSESGDCESDGFLEHGSSLVGCLSVRCQQRPSRGGSDTRQLSSINTSCGRQFDVRRGTHGSPGRSAAKAGRSPSNRPALVRVVAYVVVALPCRVLRRSTPVKRCGRPAVDCRWSTPPQMPSPIGLVDLLKSGAACAPDTSTAEHFCWLAPDAAPGRRACIEHFVFAKSTGSLTRLLLDLEKSLVHSMYQRRLRRTHGGRERHGNERPEGADREFAERRCV